MSRESVEIVRRAYEAWNRRDLAGLKAVFTPDAEIRPFLGAVLSASSYRGHEGLARWMVEAYEPWDSLRVDLRELRDVGDRVVGLAVVVGRGQGSGVDVKAEVAHIATMRGQRIARFVGYSSPSEALEAVGLSE